MIDAAQILRQSLQSTRFDDLAAQQASVQQPVDTGRAMGLSVQVMEDPMAQLQDSMEELAGQFEEKAMKDVGQRKLGEVRNRSSVLIEAVQKWSQIFKDLPGGAVVDRLLRMLRQSGSARPDAEGLLRQLGREASDPSHQFALLDILEQALSAGKGEADAELAQLVRDAKDKLNAEKGPEVKAGINLANEVNARAKTPAEMQGLRDLYRSEVLGFTKPQECFRSLLATRGAGRLSEALDFLMKGCGIDMQSATPSRSPEELRRITLDLQCVNVLKAMLERCDGLVGKMLKEFGETSLLNGERMAGEIVNLTERPFVGEPDIAALLKSCGFAQLLAKLYFTTQLTDVFRKLSPRLFSEENDRFKLVDAAQEHLDGLVAQQEAEEEREQKEAS